MKPYDQIFARLVQRAGRLPGVIIRPSRWVDGLSVWVRGKEVLHYDAPGMIDIRLTRRLIRDLESPLKNDSRVIFRKVSSDWFWVRVSGTKDFPFVLDLLRLATTQRTQGGAVPIRRPHE